LLLRRAFGNVLRRLRQERGLTQEKLALEAGRGRNYVSLLERAESQPTIPVLFDLSEVLGYKPSAIIEMVEKENQRLEKIPIRKRLRTHG